MVVLPLVGLARRDRTRSGCLVEVPMFDAALAVAAEPVLEWTAYGNRLGRDGNRSPRAAPQGLYACRGHERWLALSVLDDGQWAALVDVLGRPAWADDPALAVAAGRRDRHDELDRGLAQWAAGHAQAEARGFTEEVDHPVVGRHATQSLPFRFRSVERWIRAPAPTLGEHSREMLAKRLGCTDDELDALAEAGVIGTWPAGF